MTKAHLDPGTIDASAASIRRAYDAADPAPWTRETIAPTDLDNAYAIQHANTRHWQAAGRRVVGQKIGLTSPKVQQQLGVDQPDFGVLFADMACSDGEDMSTTHLRMPRVEGEAALMIGRDLTHPDLTLAELMRAVEYVVPAIEVVDTRYESWKITLADTVADNASSGLYVVGGRPTLLRDIDLAAIGMTLALGGEVVSRGSGRECMGHPLRAALWLARKLAALGTPLVAGQLVMTGALGPMVDVPRGDTTEVDCAIDGLGHVRCRFTPTESA